MKQMNNKRDLISVVTGATGGLGSAIVKLFLRKGMKVCITDKNTKTLNGFEKDLADDFNKDNFMFCHMDVEDPEEIEAVKVEVLSRWKRVDVLVNNAGIFDMAPVLKMDEHAFLRMLNINVLGVFRTCQIFGNVMVQQSMGKIINIGSIAGTRGLMNGGHYAASKAAVTALSLSLANELASHNVQVNVVHPGYIDTAMLDSHKEILKTAAVWRIPAKRLGLPWEVAEVVWSLITLESTYLLGTQINVDGGISIG